MAIPALGAALNGLLPPLVLSGTVMLLGCIALLVGRRRFASGDRRNAHGVVRVAGMMPFPSFTTCAVCARWTSAIVAVAGIAGTVGVFIAMLSLASGFKATLVASGAQDNAIVMRAGATSEMMSGINLDAVKILQDSPGVAHGPDCPLVSSEVVVVAPFPLISTGTDANVQVRGVSPSVLTIRKNVKIVQGRMFQAGLTELIVGRNATNTYWGLR